MSITTHNNSAQNKGAPSFLTLLFAVLCFDTQLRAAAPETEEKTKEIALSAAAAFSEVATERENTSSFLPQAYDFKRYGSLNRRPLFGARPKSAPVSRPVEDNGSFADNLTLTGLSQHGDQWSAILYDQNENKHLRVDQKKKDDGIYILSVNDNSDPREVSIKLASQEEQATLRYDELSVGGLAPNKSPRGSRPRSSNRGRANSRSKNDHLPPALRKRMQERAAKIRSTRENRQNPPPLPPDLAPPSFDMEDFEPPPDFPFEPPAGMNPSNFQGSSTSTTNSRSQAQANHRQEMLEAANRRSRRLLSVPNNTP